MNVSDVLQQSRYDAGKSQQYMADHMNVNKATVQNWESGYSAPSVEKAIEWFKVLGVPVIPYCLKLIHPSLEDVKPGANDDDIKAALIDCISEATPEQRRKLLYMFYGNHGSSPNGVLEMVTAHLHVPLKDRLNIASAIITNYEVAESTDTLIGDDNIKPNMDVLNKAFTDAKNAVKEKKNAY